MIRLSKGQVKDLHRKMLNNTGGLDGLRDESLLDSALSTAFQTFDGAELYPTVISKIARITYGLINNHPFIDGNKRVGTFVMLILLRLNQLNVSFTDDDIVRIGLSLANNDMSDKNLEAFILQRTKQ